MPGNNDVILEAARRAQVHVEAPVLGGVAVYLHGYRRSTIDLDLYTPDRKLTDEQLRAAGARWDSANREHVLDHVRIHTVTPEDTRHEVRKVSIIDGIRVVSLKDLIAIKLRTGLRERGRLKDLGDVQELIRAIPLDKTLASGLPKDLRDEYKAMVDAVRATDRGPRRF
jgi:predicted nucleotidyltransferase component of viral defense system